MKKRIFFIVSAILATLFIFGNSLKDGASSTESSRVFTDMISKELISSGKTVDKSAITYFVRKTAHLLEFALHGFLITGCFTGNFKKRIPYVLALGGITACTDEVIQIFSDGRAAMVRDFFLDLVGCGIGILVYFFARKTVTKRKA